MVKQKQELGLTVSLCIPTLNEERTIGKEIIIFKSELMTALPALKMKLQSTDSGSVDKAPRGGGFVRGRRLSGERHSAEHGGEKRGKRRKFVESHLSAQGDIIVYIGADIKNIITLCVWFSSSLAPSP